MLTAAQRAKCAKLAQALDAGDCAAYKRAEPSLTPEMRGEVWDQRRHLRAQGGRAVKAGEVISNGALGKTPRPTRVETELRDLDFGAMSQTTTSRWTIWGRVSRRPPSPTTTAGRVATTNWSRKQRHATSVAGGDRHRTAFVAAGAVDRAECR